jgi:beta-phosphoglucomutase-like phosphatase (HAD superfamily)
MIKAIFWDIDGTLLNTENFHYSHVAKVCGEKGLILDQVETVGMSNYDLWEHSRIYNFFPSYEEWVNLISQGYDKEVSSVLIREGITEVLEYFYKKGIRQIAVSNGTRFAVDVNLKNTNLLQFFEHTISFDDVNQAKPHPEPYLKALQYSGLNHNQAIAIEDTPIGLQSAKEAGLLAVAFPNPQTNFLNLDQADLTINHPQDLISIVENY